jgi:hypothetical protein
MKEMFPRNENHFKRLVPFAEEIISICNEIGVSPIIYGSFAHFYYTQDDSLNVNDIDFLIPNRKFKRILNEMKKRFKGRIILDGDTIILKKENLVVELDSSNEKELVSLKKNSKKIDFYGLNVKLIGLKDLKSIYPVAFNESVRNKGKVLEKIVSLEKFLGKKLENFNFKEKEACLEIYNKFYKRPEVLAIFNNGSSVVGQDEDGSDTDFVIVLKKEKDKNKIRNLFRRNYKIIKNEEHPDIEVEEQYEVLGKRVDPTIITKKEIDEKVNNFYKSVENYLESQHFIKHKIIDSVAIFDSEKLLIEWKKEAERYPKKFMKVVFDSQINSIKEELFYWKNHHFRNEFQFGFEQWDLIKSICQAIYAKNKMMFMLPYKRLHNDLKILKPNIEKEIYQLIRGDNTQSVIKKKIKIVDRIIKKLEK